MPYIITTTQSLETDVRGATDTVIAVATLDEARETVRATFIAWNLSHPENRNPGGISAEGGTVGPLPDGTVIEVRQLQWIELARQCEMDCGDLCAGPNEDVLAVFNGAHA